MFDYHFDLLMYILIYNEQKNIKKVKEYCEKIFKKDNITGGIFNLFYSGFDAMKEELSLDSIDMVDPVKDLKLVNDIIQEYELIPPDIKYIVGIEGLDYLKNIDDIEELYKLGLRSTNLVWNNQNKFGGGIKAPKEVGLTDLGRDLIKKIVQTNIAIDLSHANEKTFYGIIEECRKLKEQGYSPIIHASHSNSKAICNVPRNLTDDQIEIIAKEFNGTIGIVEYTAFVKTREDDSEFKQEEYEQYYLNHINHFRQLLGSVDNMAVSTDDMSLHFKNGDKPPIYRHEKVAEGIRSLLQSNGYSMEEIEKILHKNFEEKILARL